MENDLLKNVEELVEGFRSYATVIKDQANSILASISDGYSPEKKDLDSFNHNIAKLQDKYNNIKIIAQDYLSPDENPGEGAPITAYASALKDSQKRFLEEQIANAKETLNKFITVKATIEKYTNALKPFQEEAKSLLSELESGNTKSIIDSNVYAGSKCFIKVLTEKEINEEEKEVLLESIGKYYNDTVGFGVSLGKYALSPLISETEKDKCSSADINVENSSAEGDFPSLIVDPSDKPLDDESNNKSADKAAEEENEVTREPSNSDLNSEFKDEDLIETRDKIKTGAPSASAFKSDLKKPNHNLKASLFLIPLFTHTGILSVNQAYNFCRILFDNETPDLSLDIFAKELSFFSEKGFAPSFNLDVDGESVIVYALSKYVYECITKASFKKEHEKVLKYGKVKIIGKAEVSKELLLNQYNNVERLLKVIGCAAKTEGMQKAERSLDWDGSRYQITIPFDNSEYVCFIPSLNDDVKELAKEHNIVSPDPLYETIDNPAECKVVFVCRDNCIKRLEEVDDNHTNENERNDFGHPYEDDNSDNERDIDNLTDVEDDRLKESTNSQNKVADNQEYREDSESEFSLGLDNNKITEVTSDDEFISLCNKFINGKSTPSDDDFIELSKHLLSNENDYSLPTAFLLLKAVSNKINKTKCNAMYKQLSYALCMMNPETDYTENKISTVFAEKNDFTEELMLATYLRAMVLPSDNFDYELQVKTKQILKNYDSEFPNFNAIKSLYDLVLRIEEPSNNYGFSSNVINEINKVANRDILLADICEKAKALKEMPQSADSQPLKIAYKNLFGGKSSLAECMSIISRDDTGKKDIVSESLNLFSGREEKIFEDEWRKACDTSRKGCPPSLKNKAIEAIKARVDIIDKWVNFDKISVENSFDIDKITSLRNQIVERIDLCLDTLETSSSQILKLALINIKEYITGNGSLSGCIDFTEMLYTGVLPINDDGLPIMNLLWDSIQGFEPWRLVLRHIVLKKDGFDARVALDRIDDRHSSTYDNLNQYRFIKEKLLGESVSGNDFDERVAYAKESANLETDGFFASAEWACALGQISENEKDDLNDIVYSNKEFFYQVKEFGCWRQLVSLLNMIIVKHAEQRVKEKEAELTAIRKHIDLIDDDSKAKAELLYKEIVNLVENEHNFSAAEEYISHFNSGNYEITVALGDELSGEGEFSQFINCCDEIVKSVSKSSAQSPKEFVNAAKRYLNLVEPLNNAYKKNADSLLNSFPASKGNGNNAANIASFFEIIGFKNPRVTKNKKMSENLPKSFNNGEVFEMTVESTPVNGQIDYPHPIAAFGTQINNPITVIVLYGGNNRIGDIANITELGLRKPTIILHVGCSTKSERANLAKELHSKKEGSTTYLVIDRVVLVYLAKKAMSKTKFLLRVLLECTLPYTKYQPFGEANFSTPEEMFCGRTEELESLASSTAPYFIYGGRQLGKTALLDRVCSYVADHNEKSYAIRISILNNTKEEEITLKIVKQLNMECNDIFNECDSFEDLSNQIQQKIKDGTIKRLLLCLDEVDNFFGAISKNKYVELNAFDTLATNTKGKFNFIAAGLHNVCKAKNALSSNGIFGHFNTACIKPLSPAESLRLIYKPLSYLGFKIDKTELPFLMTMLSKTNYYPGLVQLFGNKLVNSIKEQYGKGTYDERNAPPFIIQKEQLKDVAVSEKLRSEIKKKLDMTLDVDKAQYHYLAKAIAMLWYEDNDGNFDGESVPLYRSKFSVGDIFDWVNMIPYMNELNLDQTKTLLDEMVDMGILTVSDSMYSFKRRSFIELIASNKEMLFENFDKKEGEDD